MIVNDAGFRPNIYQMWAMDVNLDGQISAGDLTQIMQRAVKKYTEFKQNNNYDDNGNPIIVTGTPTYHPLSKDWIWVKQDTLVDAKFRISATFPQNDGAGYSRYSLPKADTVQSIKITGDACRIIQDESFQGVMLGDVNGSYASALSSAALKSTEKNTVVFDLSRAVVTDKYIDVPVYFTSDAEVTSVDFALQYNEENLSLGSVVKNASGIETADFYSADDHTLRFTSYSMQKMKAEQNLVTIRFTTGSAVKTSDLSPVAAYVNGNPARVAVTDAKGLTNNVAVQIYPNPANSIVNVEVSANAKIVMMDLSGRSILYQGDAIANQKHEINVSDMAEGIYVIKVYNKDFVSVNKVVVKK
jgi:hypothetical protein